MPSARDTAAVAVATSRSISGCDCGAGFGTRRVDAALHKPHSRESDENGLRARVGDCREHLTLVRRQWRYSNNLSQERGRAWTVEPGIASCKSPLVSWP